MEFQTFGPKQKQIWHNWERLIIFFRVKTEFVLLAGDLDWGGRWMNLERGIRLLTQVPIFKSYWV